MKFLFKIFQIDLNGYKWINIIVMSIDLNIDLNKFIIPLEFKIKQVYLFFSFRYKMILRIF